MHSRNNKHYKKLKISAFLSLTLPFAKWPQNQCDGITTFSYRRPRVDDKPSKLTVDEGGGWRSSFSSHSSLSLDILSLCIQGLVWKVTSLLVDLTAGSLAAWGTGKLCGVMSAAVSSDLTTTASPLHKISPCIVGNTTLKVRTGNVCWSNIN